MARWNGQLAAALERLDRPAEAEACYRESIAHDEWLTGRFPEIAGIHMVLSRNREALAHLLVRRDRRDEAKVWLDRAAQELDGLLTDEWMPRGPGGGLAERLARLAAAYKELGDTARAAELTE